MNRRKDEARQAREAERQCREAECEALRRERDARLQAKETPNLLGEMLHDVPRQARRTVTTSVGREIDRLILRGILGGLFEKNNLLLWQ